MTNIMPLPPAQPPILLVVVDTEEERNWGDYDRSQTSVTAMRRIQSAQRLFDSFGIRPTYVIDYPVASQPEGFEPLKEIASSGRAVIGAHLRPWVNPPYVEAVTPYNSYPGNLAAPLEAAKLKILADTIAHTTGARPVVYKAGRYGIGPHTARILADQCFEIDLSVSPAYDYRHDGGPDFSDCSAHPYWFGPESRLLEIPCTGGFVGFLSGGAPRLHRLAANPSLRWTRLPGILSRLGALDRLRLSPEGFGPRDHRRLTRALLDRGVRVLTFSFHSPSLEPGCTPYVRSEAGLTAFLDSCRRYFDFFLGELGGVSMTPLELKRLVSPVIEPAVRPAIRAWVN